MVELTSEFVRARVERAAVEQLRRLLDSEAMRGMFRQLEAGPKLRDIDQSML